MISAGEAVVWTPSALSFARAWEASGVCGWRCNKKPEFVDSGFFLCCLNQCESFVQLGRRSFRISAEVLENSVVVLDGFGVVLLTVGDFTEVELCASGEIIHRVVVDHVLELTCGNWILGGVVIAESGLKGLSQRRRGRGACCRRVRCAGRG